MAGDLFGNERKFIESCCLFNHIKVPEGRLRIQGVNKDKNNYFYIVIE